MVEISMRTWHWKLWKSHSRWATSPSSFCEYWRIVLWEGFKLCTGIAFLGLAGVFFAIVLLTPFAAWFMVVDSNLHTIGIIMWVAICFVIGATVNQEVRYSIREPGTYDSIWFKSYHFFQDEAIEKRTSYTHKEPSEFYKLTRLWITSIHHKVCPTIKVVD